MLEQCKRFALNEQWDRTAELVMAHNPAPGLGHYNQLGKKTSKPAQKTPHSHHVKLKPILTEGKDSAGT